MKGLFQQWGYWIARLVLGGVFIYAAILKIGEPQEFADSIAAYQILPFSVINVVALGLPLFELTCGLAVLTGFSLRIGVLGILLSLSVFILALIISLLRGISIDCGCFGSHSWFDSNPWYALVRDIIFLGMAVFVYRKTLDQFRSDDNPKLLPNPVQAKSVETIIMRFLTFLLVTILMSGTVKADPFPDPDLPSGDVIASTPGLTIYQTKTKALDDGKFGVCIPSAYKPDQPMRLIVSSHGNGGNGETEARDWKDLAEKYGFIVVCPSYLSPSLGPNDQVMATDNETLKEIMHRVLASLNIDRAKVLHTGVSGGSLSTWYVAAPHDEWFTALCTRSGNFRGEPQISLSRWRHRPIYIFWGENDLPNIPGEGQSMLDFVQKTLRSTSVKHEVIPDGHHESRPDLVAKWFAGLTDADFEPPDPDAPVHFQ